MSFLRRSCYAGKGNNYVNPFFLVQDMDSRSDLGMLARLLRLKIGLLTYYIGLRVKIQRRFSTIFLRRFPEVQSSKSIERINTNFEG